MPSLTALRDVAVPALVPELLGLVFGEAGALRDGAVAVLERALATATPPTASRRVGRSRRSCELPLVPTGAARGGLEAPRCDGWSRNPVQDPSPGVTHAARDALRSHRASLDPAALRLVLHGSAPMHGKLDALTLADALSKWDRLAVLLDAVAAHDPRVRDDARRRTGGWMGQQNASFAQPSAAQLTALRTSLARSAAALPSPAVAEIGSRLDDWTR